MFRIFVFLILLPQLIIAQTNTVKGVLFEQPITWNQIKQRAFQEKKYIFVDCMATWCQPCKAMERNVYELDSVGVYLNRKFISLKLQLDSSKNDSKLIKSWYSTAQKLKKAYTLNSIPTFLIFSPDGKLLHRGAGYKSPMIFMLFMRDALNPKRQYYPLLSYYQKGVKNYETWPYLVQMTKELENTKLAGDIARRYIDMYLFKLNDNEFYQAKNLFFISDSYTYLSIKSKSFNIFRTKEKKIDSITGIPGMSKSVVDAIIYHEMITPRLIKANSISSVPDWKKLQNDISIQFGDDLAVLNVLRAQINWFFQKRDWDSYCQYIVKLVNMQSSLDGISLNNYAFEIFKYSNDTTLLNDAASWSDRTFGLLDKGLYPTLFDTKANLLYKLGRKDEAIKLESKILLTQPKNRQVREILEKMKNGTATWPTE